MAIHNLVIFEEGNIECKKLDALIRDMQNETPNEDWGYYHFSKLVSIEGDNLREKLLKILSLLPYYENPYRVNSDTGELQYYSSRDLNYLELIPIIDLKSEIVNQADHYANYQGPTANKNVVTEKYYGLRDMVAEKIYNFLHNLEIRDVAFVEGINTHYSFGGDHIGSDIVIETKSGIYVIHFGFSS